MKPYYFDACHHGEDCLLGTVEEDDRILDVYGVDVSATKLRTTCIRYGEEVSEYESGVGSLNMPILNKERPSHWLIGCWLTKNGVQFTWIQDHVDFGKI